MRNPLPFSCNILLLYRLRRTRNTTMSTTQTLGQWILRTDASSTPLEWIGYQDAVRFYYTGQVAYTCGENTYRIHGGINARTGRQSVIDINSIIATHGNNPRLHQNYVPPLNNLALFKRDAFLCMYCGGRFHRRHLSRDHIIPLSMGGKDDWKNVVAACRSCNNAKAGHTPEQAKMHLLAIPFTPTHAEYVYLQARNILADQMVFLRNHFPRNSRLRDRRRQ